MKWHACPLGPALRCIGTVYRIRAEGQFNRLRTFPSLSIHMAQVPIRSPSSLWRRTAQPSPVPSGEKEAATSCIWCRVVLLHRQPTVATFALPRGLVPPRIAFPTINLLLQNRPQGFAAHGHGDRSVLFGFDTSFVRFIGCFENSPSTTRTWTRGTCDASTRGVGCSARSHRTQRIPEAVRGPGAEIPASGASEKEREADGWRNDE